MSDRAYAKVRVQQKTLIGSSSKNSLLQRTCACGQHTGGGDCTDCRKKREGVLQGRAATSNEPTTVPPIVSEVLRSPGQPLDTATRAFMEPRFGHDFSGVRLHSLRERSLPSLRENIGELETGHSDCDWDRDVPDMEVYVPKSGAPVVKISDTEKCTKTCTQKHEDSHRAQLKPVCKSYYDCYTQAPSGAAKAQECKGLKGTDLSQCIGLKTQAIRFSCFIEVGKMWETRKWECAAYKASLDCVAQLQQQGDNAACSGKLGSYRYSTGLKIKKYCETEQSQPRESQKPKEPAKRPAK